jgi:ketosteroid isomerase-like protein
LAFCGDEVLLCEVPVRNIAIVFLLSILTAIPANAQYTEYKPRTKDEIALVKLEDAWCDAAIRRDRGKLEAVFADDLIWLTDSASMNREQAINHYLTETQIYSLRQTEVVIRIYGDAAVVTSHVHVKYKKDGKDLEDTHGSTDVFVKRHGRWWLVST